MDSIDQAKKVLLVDGNGGIRKFLTIKLRSAGFSVFTAEDGEQALEMSARIKPDIVVLASPVAEAEGALTRRLRELLRRPVAVYGMDICGQAEKEGLGASAYIERPYEPDEFLKQVQDLLSQTCP